MSIWKTVNFRVESVNKTLGTHQYSSSDRTQVTISKLNLIRFFKRSEPRLKNFVMVRDDHFCRIIPHVKGAVGIFRYHHIISQTPGYSACCINTDFGHHPSDDQGFINIAELRTLSDRYKIPTQEDRLFMDFHPQDSPRRKQENNLF